MKTIKNLVLLVLLVNVIVSNKVKSKVHLKHKTSTKFDKKSNKERYRVESENANQKKNSLTDLLAKVLQNKDEKDLSSGDSQEGLQQLQSMLNKMPQQTKDDNKDDDKKEDDGSQVQQQLMNMIKNNQAEQSEDNSSPQEETNQVNVEELQQKQQQQQKLQQQQEEIRMKKAAGDDKKKKKKVYEKYWEITIPKDHIEAQKKNNTKAEALFTTNSQGSDQEDKSGSSFEGELELKINNKEVPDELEEQGMTKFYVRLNSHSIYAAANKTAGYRGMVASIEFEDIITKEDYTLIGKCCQNVYSISTEKKPNGEDTYCFTIDTPKITWEACGADKQQMDTWRNNLNGFVIIWDLKKKGIYDAKELKRKQANICEFPIGYNYFNQEQWPCNCAEGLQQSPIDLVTEEASSLTRARTNWFYNKGSNLLAKQFWKETITLGTFGQFEYVNELFDSKTWTANEVRFKFPSEHSIDGKFFDGEIQIVHTNSENDRAFVSLMIKKSNDQSKDMDDILNKFMFELYPDRNQHKAGNIGCIDSTPNLMDTLKIKNFLMSYFTYQGSDTLPPCNEAVTWFVYTTPVRVSGLTIDLIKRKILGNSNAKNNRQIMPTMQRPVHFWKDNCPKVEEPIPNDFQYVKVDGTRDFYGIYKKDQELGFDGNVHFQNKDLKIEELKDEKLDKIPADTFDKLVKKFQLYISGTTPDNYDYYGKNSTWLADYKALTGNVAEQAAKDEFARQNSRRRR